MSDRRLRQLERAYCESPSEQTARALAFELLRAAQASPGDAHGFTPFQVRLSVTIMGQRAPGLSGWLWVGVQAVGRSKTNAWWALTTTQREPSWQAWHYSAQSLNELAEHLSTTVAAVKTPGMIADEREALYRERQAERWLDDQAALNGRISRVRDALAAARNLSADAGLARDEVRSSPTAWIRADESARLALGRVARLEEAYEELSREREALLARCPELLLGEGAE